MPNVIVDEIMKGFVEGANSSSLLDVYQKDGEHDEFFELSDRAISTASIGSAKHMIALEILQYLNNFKSWFVSNQKLPASEEGVFEMQYVYVSSLAPFEWLFSFANITLPEDVRFGMQISNVDFY